MSIICTSSGGSVDTSNRKLYTLHWIQATYFTQTVMDLKLFIKSRTSLLISKMEEAFETKRMPLSSNYELKEFQSLGNDVSP